MDPFNQVQTGDRIPTSSRTWNAILRTVRNAINRETPPIGGPTRASWRPPDLYVKHTGSTRFIPRGRFLPFPLCQNDYLIEGLPVSDSYTPFLDRPADSKDVVIEIDFDDYLDDPKHASPRAVMVAANGIRPGDIGGVYTSGLHWLNIALANSGDDVITPAKKKFKYLAAIPYIAGYNPILSPASGFPIVAKQKSEGDQTAVNFLVNINQYISPVHRVLIYTGSPADKAFIIDDYEFTNAQLKTMSYNDLTENYATLEYFADRWYSEFTPPTGELVPFGKRFVRFPDRSMILCAEGSDGIWHMVHERGIPEVPVETGPITKWLGYGGSTGNGALLYGDCCYEEPSGSLSASAPVFPADPPEVTGEDFPEPEEINYPPDDETPVEEESGSAVSGSAPAAKPPE